MNDKPTAVWIDEETALDDRDYEFLVGKFFNTPDYYASLLFQTIGHLPEGRLLREIDKALKYYEKYLMRSSFNIADPTDEHQKE